MSIKINKAVQKSKPYKLVTQKAWNEKNQSNVDGDIEIKITGLKKGEKIHEELLISNKVMRSKFNEIFIEQVKFE